MVEYNPYSLFLPYNFVMSLYLPDYFHFVHFYPKVIFSDTTLGNIELKLFHYQGLIGSLHYLGP